MIHCLMKHWNCIPISYSIVDVRIVFNGVRLKLIIIQWPFSLLLVCILLKIYYSFILSCDDGGELWLPGGVEWRRHSFLLMVPEWWPDCVLWVLQCLHSVLLLQSYYIPLTIWMRYSYYVVTDGLWFWWVFIFEYWCWPVVVLVLYSFFLPGDWWHSVIVVMMMTIHYYYSDDGLLLWFNVVIFIIVILVLLLLVLYSLLLWCYSIYYWYSTIIDCYYCVIFIDGILLIDSYMCNV